MGELVRYDAMCRAIDAAHAVDEVKDIRDKAMAIEAYARQARNVEAEARACEIRLRAERKAGTLLKDMEKARGNGSNQHQQCSQRASIAPKPLSDLGISHTQSSRWQRLADIPQDEFEATFAKSDKKPSTSGIIASHNAKRAPEAALEPSANPVDPRALWLWGRLLDFERQGILDADPNQLVDGMLGHMQQATRELVPSVIEWLERIDR